MAHYEAYNEISSKTDLFATKEPMESFLHDEHRTPPFSYLFMENLFNGQKKSENPRANYTPTISVHACVMCVHVFVCVS